MADRPNRRAAGRAARAPIRPGDRVTIVGTSGSGKSTLVRELILRYRRAVVLDTKLDGHPADWHRSVGAAALEHDFPRHFERVVAQPAPGEDYLEWFDRSCWHLFRAGAVAVGVDDLPAELTVAGRRSPGLELLYRQGRSRQVTTFGCIQRPAAVPLVMLTEAVHLFVFQLFLAEDRDRLRKLVGPIPQPRHKHGFVYARPGTAEPPVECTPLPRPRHP